MKRFLVKAAALLLPMVLITVILDGLYIRTNYYRSENDLNRFDYIPGSLDIANLGSSHGMKSFEYSIIPGLTGANLGSTLQTFVFDRAIIEHYAGHFRPGAVILIPVSLPSLFIARDLGFQQIKPRYYRVLPDHLMPQFSFIEKFRYSLVPVFSSGDNLFKILRDIPEEDMDHWYRQSPGRYGLDYEANARIKHSDWENTWRFSKTRNLTAYEDNMELLVDLVEYIRSQSLVPVFVTTPLLGCLNELFAPEFIDEFNQGMEDLQNRTGVEYWLDYSRAPAFQEDKDLFHDPDHMGRAGAELLTRLVVDDLRSLGLLPR